ncbi:hypothetical protein CC1G_13689 [Coprinopsis cinerea okayama7|uniref:Uncharacterized protein n=1 Tax=Coprinopsis cinerea (strain Okayama-7 / 130 / ATCC MYA-4618 / FGSC 9003) TaxID=240176 RepID=D6RJY4_COPC7|nr:hypothetical protein CC1G_13689 [Coprinopsis cinerea okayama7\|eukprot:XP_002912157.1 hypothetical protein CC1G_13689 [Coprinopsis cinerea okayama7\
MPSIVPLQRSQSAPQPIASLVQTSTSDARRQPLPRTVSHEQVQKHKCPPHMKPLTSTLATGPASPMNVDQEDPFNLLTFFPPGIGRRDDWHWLRGEALAEEVEEASIDVEGDDGGDSPAIFVPTEDRHMSEAIKGEDKLGILSFGYRDSHNDDDDEDDLDDVEIVDETGRFEPEIETWEDLYEAHRRRRMGGKSVPAVEPCSELFFGDGRVL